VIVDTPIGGGAPAPAGGPPPRVHAVVTIVKDPRRIVRGKAVLIWKGIAPEAVTHGPTGKGSTAVKREVILLQVSLSHSGQM
jgi:hypothetical protein